MSSHPFIDVSVKTVTNNNVLTSKINAIYLIGIATTGNIGDNKIAKINTLADFDLLIGANALSRNDYAFIRKIDNNVPIYFVNGKATGTPTDSDNLLAGVLLLSLNLSLEPGIIICPEARSLTQILKSTLVSAIENFVSSTLVNWQFFCNSLLATNDTTKAITERNLYTSPQGHTTFFFGYGKDENGNNIGLASVSAALLTLLNRTRSGYLSPSAYLTPIPYVSVDPVYMPLRTRNVNEFRTLNDQGINTIYYDGNIINDNTGTYTLCGARTLSKDQAWLHINTRYAANNVFNRCVSVLNQFLFLPADINALPNSVINFQASINNADIILALRVLLDQLVDEGAFASPPSDDNNNLGEPYEIKPSKSPNGDLNIEISVSLVQTRERISLNFVKRG